MVFRKGAAVAALLISALGITAGTAAAEPAQDTPDLRFRGTIVDGSVVLDMEAGSVAVTDDHLRFIDRHGSAVASLPLTYIRGGAALPITARLDGDDSVTLTAITDPAAARPIDPAIAAEIEEITDIGEITDDSKDAMNDFSMALMTATSVGSLLGTAIGGGIGCVAGGIIGAVTGTVVTIGLLAIPGAIGGCIVTGAALAAIGAVAGTVLIGLPALLAAGTQFWNDTHPPAAPAPHES
ncbi:hypothetical protein [Nocardia paucivorans]|uniref:hypothetical protein n=1 Tax=Nocardia paucivorans TaxID=114259 RepID=UPI000300E9B8|nr:hypothetical protein [Nocardia paucivorans]